MTPSMAVTVEIKTDKRRVIGCFVTVKSFDQDVIAIVRKGSKHDRAGCDPEIRNRQVSAA